MKGHITKKKRGEYYYFVIDIGRDPETGKRRQRWFKGATTKKETQVLLTQKLMELQEGTYVEKNQMTVGAFASQWLVGKKSSIRDGTYSVYRSYVNLYITPYIGDIKMQELAPQHIQQLHTALLERIVPSTIAKVHKILRAIMDEAMTFGIIRKNVVRLVQTPKAQKPKISYWNEEQVRTLLATSQKSRFYIAYLLAVTTGMRVGEVLGLRWQDVDLERGVLSIMQTLSQNSTTFSETKTESGRRSVTLLNETLRALKEHRIFIAKEKLRAGDAYRDHDLVVCTALGKPVNHTNFRDRWKKEVLKADLPHIRFHDLRHTHATLLLKQGVHPKIVSERLGHANVNITLNTYSHILPGLQEEAARNLNDLLFHQTTFPNEKQSKF